MRSADDDWATPVGSDTTAVADATVSGNNHLAYFRIQWKATGVKGPTTMTNPAAMNKRFKLAREAGATPDQIRAVIDRFCAQCKSGSIKITRSPWQAFLYYFDTIMAEVLRTGAAYSDQAAVDARRAKLIEQLAARKAEREAS